MKIIDCKQGSEEWLFARSGIVTASEIDQIISPTWKIRDGKMVDTYLYQKLAERCMGAPLQTGSSWSMEQGTAMETEAREALPFLAAAEDVNVQRVGFCVNDDGSAGCSPDALVNDDGGLELKAPRAGTHLRYLTAGVVPEQYLPQIHCCMFVTGRAWWYFMSYSRFFPPLLLKVMRDEAVMKSIGEAVQSFNAKLDAAYAKIKAMAREEDPRPLPPHKRFRPLIF